MIRGLEDAAFRFDPNFYDRVFEKLDGQREETEVRTGQEVEPEAAGG
ncbi:MAG TPA: hypothetical protein VF789_32580 [Thermoanaerobaculia bacterium]